MNLKSQTVKKNILSFDVKEGTIRKLVGGGRSTKKYLQGKIKRKKIHARQLTLKNIHAMA